ncbi:MAG TPA: peptidyl-prolyl cis-trans isomerase [Caulobacteraceae bacterium]|nr:peptidyl-prolyl cis-trans isomerase [Caulobacteraceae bacterium]
MISFIRRIVKSWVSMILIGLLIISFAVWGTSDVLLGGASDTVVKAGSRQLSSSEFRREFDQYKAQTEERAGQPIPIDLAVERGLDRQVLEGLANRESLAEMFHRMGVRVSDNQVADQIKAIPAFFDRVSGKFDEKLYAGALAERQLTPELFEGYLRDEMSQQQVSAAMAAGLRAPRAYAALGAAYALEGRDLSWFLINPGMVPEPPRPTDAQLQAFMKENAERLTRPEFRQLTVVRFSSAAIEPTIQVDAAEVQRRFDFRKDSLSTPELRTVVQIPAKDAATAARVAQALNAGGDIAAAAKAAGSEPLVYADKPRTAIVDRRVAEAAFSLPEGAVSPPIQGELGYAVVKVMKVTPGKAVSFAEVRPAIEAELRADAAGEKVYEQTQIYEDAHTAGATLAEAAAKAGAQTLTVGPVTAQGQNMQGQPSGVPEQILKAAFDLPAGGESDIEEGGKGEYYAVRVEKVIPATLPPLAEVRDDLARAWMLREVVKAMQAKADGLAERVRKGEAMDAVAASTDATVTSGLNISRARAQENSALGRDFLIKAFEAKPGEIFTAQSPSFGIAVAKLDNVNAARAEQVAQFVEPQREQLTMDLFRQIGNSAETYARLKLKTRTYLDRARMALGIDPKEVDADAGKTVEPDQ